MSGVLVTASWRLADTLPPTASPTIAITPSSGTTTRLNTCNETTVGGWVKKYRAAHAADEPPLELSERARLRELERRTRELEIENAFLKKVAAHFAREQR